MTEILDKTKEWSDRFGSRLRASAETQYPHLYKGAVGGLTHVISVDNGGAYMEMWRDGGDQYYATTGAAIKPLPGLAKGARLDEALDRFFTLMAKVEKGKAEMKRRLNMRGPAKKAIPKKIKRLLGLKKQDTHPYGTPAKPSTPHGGAGRVHTHPGGKKGITEHGHPQGQAHKSIRKRVMEKVDPEIGPSRSVAQRKPSDLSPESGVSKLAKNLIKQMTEEERFRRGGAPSKPIQPMHPGQRMGGGPESIQPLAPHPGRPAPKKMRKNVVALTGNQPGSGRVKPQTKPGTPPKTYRSPQGFSGRRMGTPVGGGTSGGRLARAGALGQKTTQRRAPYVGSRPKGLSAGLGKGRKVDDLEGGRVGEGGKITPVKPATGGPGQPSSYGSTGNPQYDYSRYRKACDCTAAEVAKAVKAVRGHGGGMRGIPPHDPTKPHKGHDIPSPRPKPTALERHPWQKAIR